MRTETDCTENLFEHRLSPKMNKTLKINARTNFTQTSEKIER